MRAELILRHVTAMVDGGLVLLTNSKDAPYQLMTQIRCDDCTIAATNEPPLVEQRGSDGVDQYRTRFQWSGENNYFDGFNVFWRITNAVGQAGSSQLDFDKWVQLWQGQSRKQMAGRNAVAWAGLPAANQPFHTHTPADYLLDGEAADNPAAGGASDRLDAGFMAAELPAIPSREQSSEARPDSPMQDP